MVSVFVSFLNEINVELLENEENLVDFMVIEGVFMTEPFVSKIYQNIEFLKSHIEESEIENIAH